MNPSYRYVFFYNGGSAVSYNPGSYHTVCYKDLESDGRACAVSWPLDYAPKWLRYLYWIHNSPKTNRLFSLPLKKLWYPHYFHDQPAPGQRYCFVVSNLELPVDYYRYLKKKYPGSKMVLLHRDLVELSMQWHPEYTEEIRRELFDVRFTYDREEAARYGFRHFDEFESLTEVRRAENYPLWDVYFAGKAKDRLPQLLAVYRRLTAAGLTCHYYLTGVAPEQREPLPGITYADENIPYIEMLYHTVNARCVLDINQGGAVGYTSRFLEAVMYNKKLLTNNPSVKESKFYREDCICCYSSVDEIDPSFVTEGAENVDYHYQNEFSPTHLIEVIEGVLAEWTEEQSGEV